MVAHLDEFNFLSKEKLQHVYSHGRIWRAATGQHPSASAAAFWALPLAVALLAYDRGPGGASIRAVSFRSPRALFVHAW